MLEDYKNDMLIGMRKLQVQKAMITRDMEHYEAALGVYTAFIAELEGMPECPARSEALETAAQQANQVREVIDKGGFSRAAQTILAALEQSVLSGGTTVAGETDDFSDLNDKPEVEDTGFSNDPGTDDV